MSNESSIPLPVKNQFRDINSLLSAVRSNLAAHGVDAADELTRVADALKFLEQKVTDSLVARQSQLGALMGIGRLINSSLALKHVLEEVMDSLIGLMQAERGFLMLRDDRGELVVQTARGMAQANLEEDTFAVSRTIIRRVTETGEPILTTNAQEDWRFGKQESIAAYHLRSILCAPLKLKTELIGVLYVDHRGMSGMFQEGDLSLISAFADQAAVAINNARLFESLKAAHADLEIAYDATLQGWVHALDLRDKETEGHTQRVTALTRNLAIVFGIGGDELTNVTRGALLHDIGKMAISDSILRKPGQLSPEEREIMKQHPVYAHDMLSKIQFLVPALDIPYCHHEKWDGSGYPRGLKGEEIPFAARLFSIVDVMDALTSDRPYHKARTLDEARAYIREQADTHFDPKIVKVFTSLGDALFDEFH